MLITSANVVLDFLLNKKKQIIFGSHQVPLPNPKMVKGN